MREVLGRLVGFEPTTSRTTIWRYYQLSYSRRDVFILTQPDGSREIPAGRGTHSVVGSMISLRKFWTADDPDRAT